MKHMHRIVLFTLAALAPLAAQAHPGHDLQSGLLMGLMHPFTGWDHLAVLLCLGALAAGRATSRSRQRRECSMRILMISAEMAPLVKVGGLGDVVGALGQALVARGHAVKIVMPLYGHLDRKALSLEPDSGLGPVPLRVARAS